MTKKAKAIAKRKEIAKRMMHILVMDSKEDIAYHIKEIIKKGDNEK